MRFQKPFLALGETAEFDYNGYNYKIVARYGVGMLFAHDPVGFDLRRRSDRGGKVIVPLSVSLPAADQNSSRR